MGPGLHAHGPAPTADGAPPRFRTRAEFLDSIEAIVKQDVVDIMLTSVSNLESLVKRNVFAGTGVKPVIRANDTTDIWRHRGASFHNQPSRPFRTASLRHVKPLTDLGLYSITFTNDIEADHVSLEAFTDFRDDAEENGFSYFLEVFNPNVERGLTPETMPQFVNDAIVRCLAGLTRGGAAKVPQDRLQRTESAGGAGVVRSQPRRRRTGRRRGHDPRLLRAHPSGGEIWRAGRAVRPQDQPRGIAARHRASHACGRRWSR